MKLKTPAIVAISMAFGIVAGASVSAIASGYPNMDAALSHLAAADAFLQKASDDKGGHRIKARKLIAEAADEVKAGIKYANHN